MKYFSLNNISPAVDFRDATILGQAPDKGLYFPEEIPHVGKDFIASLPALSNAEIGFAVMKPYVKNVIPDEVLRSIVEETLNFEIPLVRVNDDIYSLELFHGPTLAFKDVGARFMSRCLGYFSRNNKHKVTVLVATSGDTGGAVADGFFDVDGVEVVILYPSGKVSKVQEQQLTTYGGNIHALEVKGDFDACQRLVKQAFTDVELSARLSLTSANSINVARWLPQQMYYFLALKQWPHEEPPVFAVPSGNFGNICAGIMAWKSGLPVSHFIAACNANDVVPAYFLSGKYQPITAKATLSNAMDVGDPSNFGRIMQIFGQSFPLVKEQVSSMSVSDEATIDTIKKVLQDFDYLLDPHGAVGYYAFEKYRLKHPTAKGIVLETAHPVKFPGAIEKIMGQPLDYPSQVKQIMEKQNIKTTVSSDYQTVKNFLLNFIA